MSEESRSLNTKRCTKCWETKPLAEFGKKKQHPDGHDYRCRACKKEYREEKKHAVAARLSAHPELIPSSKTCRRCGQAKPLSDFTKSGHNEDGRLNQCRTCELQLRWAREGAPTTEYFDDPDFKRCPRCREVKSRRNDFYPRHQEVVSVLLVSAYCKQCCPAAKREYLAANREACLQRRRERYRRRAAFFVEQKRRWREAYPEANKAERKRYYRRCREKLLLQAKRYRETHRDRIKAYLIEWRKRHPNWHREYRSRNRERICHYRRVKYWENPEKRRLQQALYRQNDARVGRTRQTVSLNDTFGETGTISRLDRVADTRIVSPEAAAVEAPSLQAVRAFVREEVSDQEREILEAFADCFSAEGTAELLGITAAEVEATMSAIRSRAAALASSEAEER